MLQKTRGIVLRAIKYGETSLICSIFTEVYGVQSYLVQGVRSAKSRNNKAGLLQPGTLLDLVVYHNPQKGLQRIKEFQLAYLYQHLQEDILKNTVALFSVELLLRLLPEQAEVDDLFTFSYDYFCLLDKVPTNTVGNYPLFFITHVSKLLGYHFHGRYSIETPHLNLQEGSFTAQPPAMSPFVSDNDARAIDQLSAINDIDLINEVKMNTDMRFRLLDWYLAYLHQHTQHMAELKSLPILRAILH